MTPFRRIALVLPLLSCLLALGGCAHPVSHEQDLIAPPVDPGSLLAIDVENFRGSVEIRVDPRLDAIEVEGRAFGAWFEHDDGARDEVMRVISLDSELEESEGVATLRVRTSTLRAPEDHGVRILIRAPRCDAARVRNRGGLVELVGAGGSLDIENYEGHVEYRSNRPLTDDATILVVDGTVYFQIPEGSTGLYDLETLDGQVRFKNRVGDASDTYSTRTTLRTMLESDDNRVVMRTNYGDLRVLVMEDPESLTRTIRLRQVDHLDGLYLQGSRRYTRNLPDDEERTSIPDPTSGYPGK